jgi:hypothetical protein
VSSTAGYRSFSASPTPNTLALSDQIDDVGLAIVPPDPQAEPDGGETMEPILMPDVVAARSTSSAEAAEVMAQAVARARRWLKRSILSLLTTP